MSLKTRFKLWQNTLGLGLHGTQSPTIARQLEGWAARRPARKFLLYAQRGYSYAEANALINRHAHAYRALGIGHGDVVALMIENRPELLWHLYGLHKLGAAASMINTHLSGEVLRHALEICAPKRIVVGSELFANLAEIQADLGDVGANGVHVDVDPDAPEGNDSAPSWRARAPAFAAELASAPDENPASSGEVKLEDLAAYIYTSGTTGRPKAAIVRHERMVRAGAAWTLVGVRHRRGDVMYNCLPLYHANGMLLATGSVITAGVTMALARRFSRTRFWDDVRAHRATSFIYIGELCRYLMNNPPAPDDRDHAIRAITGNGLRPDIWRDFQRRFGIRRVAEFYGATEGNSITINMLNLPGSVGPLLPGMALAKWDPAQMDFARDARGFLIKARAGEIGILLGKLRTRFRFDGYHDADETKRKIIHDAFETGDAYFNTGDLLRIDWRRHLYFTDRIGDTFRWKGENVSTTEVQEQLSRLPEIAEANVYGVEIPGVEGRAGMAALVLANGHAFDPEGFKSHVDKSLPSYARPLFVRLQAAIEKTSTLKMKKAELQREGFDPSAIHDPIYFRDAAHDRYAPLDVTLYRELCAGRIKL